MGSGEAPTTANIPRTRTVWHQDRLWAVHANPAKVLLKRVAVPPAQQHAYTEEGTVGVVIDITGTGAHLRFGGESGIHEIKSPDPDEGGTPDVFARLSGESLAAYRPPEECVRRGWFRDDTPTRFEAYGW